MMIRLRWKRLLRGGLPLGYLLLSACGGGGDGASGSDSSLVSKDLPWRIPSAGVYPSNPLDRVGPEKRKSDDDDVMKAEDIVVPEIVMPHDIDPNDAERQLANFRKQSVKWGTCFNVVETDEFPSLNYARDHMGWQAQIECARVKVPLNYGAPVRDGTTELKLFRISAGDPSRKRHLLFNPGGPGATGLLSPVGFATATRHLANNEGHGGKTPHAELVELANSMLQKYAFVGFSPRGSKEMLPVEVARGRQYGWSWETDEKREERRLEKNSRALGAAFARNKNAPYVHSEAVARDMDLIRHLLGDEQLHFYGASYGTHLGLWYAGRFPKTTGRMLLEAVVEYEGDPLVVSLQKSGPWLRNFIGQMPYVYSVMDSAKFFPKHRQDIDITEILGKLDVPLQYLVMDQLHAAAYRAVGDSGAYDYLIAVLLAAKYFQEGESTNQTFSEDAEIDRLIKAVMVRFSYLKAQSQSAVTFHVGQTFSRGLNAYWCNDAQAASSPESLRAALKRAAGPYYLADIEGMDSPCAFWPFKRQPFPKPSLDAIHATGADSKILMLNAEWDRATVMSGAQKTRNGLPNARFITYLESTRHNFFPTASLIVDQAVYRHFVDDRLPDSDIAEKGSVFDALIGKSGDWIRDPQRNANERLHHDFFNESKKPPYHPSKSP